MRQPDLSRHKLKPIDPEPPLPRQFRKTVDGIEYIRVYDIHIDGWVWSPFEGQQKEEELFDAWLKTTGLERGDPNLKGHMGDQDIYAKLKLQHKANRRCYIPAPPSKELLEKAYG